MASKIKVTTSKLTSTANTLSSTGSQINSLTSQMLNIISSTSDWTGDASSAYKKKFNGLQDDMKKITKMINEHVEDLGTMAKAYDSAEQANVSAANALNGNVIS